MKLKGYKIERKKCCCGCSLRTGTLWLAVFQLLTVGLWVLTVILYRQVFKPNLQVPYSTIYIGIFNIIVTIFCSVSILIGYCKRNELVLRVSSIFQLFLTSCILVTSVVLFFYEFWIATFMGILLIFLYFYFYTVIQSYVDELFQARKLLEVSSTSIVIIPRY